MKQLEEKIANILSPYVHPYGEYDKAEESWFRIDYTGTYQCKTVTITSLADIRNFAKGSSIECSGMSIEEVFAKAEIKILDRYPHDFYFTFSSNQLKDFDVDPKKVQLQVFASDIFDARRRVSNKNISFTGVMVRHEAQKHRDVFGATLIITLEDLLFKQILH